MQFYSCLSLFYLIPHHINHASLFYCCFIFRIFNTQTYHLPTSFPERKDAFRIKLITCICTSKHQCFVPIEIKQAWTKFNVQHFLNRPAVQTSIYLIKVKKRNNRNLRRSNVFIVNSKHNSHHFLAFLLLNLNKKIFLGCLFSDYDTISNIMLNKLLHGLFFKQ